MIDQAKKLRDRLGDNKIKSPSQSENPSILPKNKGDPANETKCQSIAITSGKGGVGKSNIAISLALALQQLDHKVLIFDGDLGLANIHILLGISPKYTLAHVVQEECSLTEIMCPGPAGITILPGSSGLSTMANLPSVQLELLMRKLVAIEHQFNYMIIDGGAGIGYNAIQLSSMADSILLVLSPDPASLADAYSTAKILIAKGIQKISVLVNMAESNNNGKEIFCRLQSLVKKFLHRDVSLAGILPYDKQVIKLIRKQKNMQIEKQSATFSYQIQKLAGNICGKHTLRKGSFFSRLFNSQLRGE